MIERRVVSNRTDDSEERFNATLKGLAKAPRASKADQSENPSQNSPDPKQNK